MMSWLPVLFVFLPIVILAAEESWCSATYDTFDKSAMLNFHFPKDIGDLTQLSIKFCKPQETCKTIGCSISEQEDVICEKINLFKDMMCLALGQRLKCKIPRVNSTYTGRYSAQLLPESVDSPPKDCLLKEPCDDDGTKESTELKECEPSNPPTPSREMEQTDCTALIVCCIFIIFTTCVICVICGLVFLIWKEMKQNAPKDISEEQQPLNIEDNRDAAQINDPQTTQ